MILLIAAGENRVVVRLYNICLFIPVLYMFCVCACDFCVHYAWVCIYLFMSAVMALYDIFAKDRILLFSYFKDFHIFMFKMNIVT